MLSTPAPSEPHRDQMIRRAGLRREMLEQLSAMGMKAAERLAGRTWAPEVGCEAAGNGVAFAKVSRAVRLTLILEARIDEEILALSNGLIPTAVAWLEPAGAPARSIPARDHETVERRAEREPIAEREFDRQPTGGFRNWIAAICDDLEIEPDWSGWSGAVGFVHDDGRPVTAFESWLVDGEGARDELAFADVGEETPSPRASAARAIRDVSD